MMRKSAHVMSLSASCSLQGGQALVESLAAMLGLAALWVALHWLAHYQDAALSATHASRHAAFVVSRNGPQEQTAALTAPFFSGMAHRWTDRRGKAVLQPDTSVSLAWARLTPLSALGQPGGHLAHATSLRRDWSLEDTGLMQARLSLNFDQAERQSGHPHTDGSLLRLGAFDHAYPSLVRSTSILTGAGHAASDSEVQSTVAASSLAWAAAHAASRAAGIEIRMRAEAVDGGWGRPAPSFDWLQPWSGHVPAHLITEYEATGRN